MHLSITTRLMVGALSLVPFGMCVEGLWNGWIGLPAQRPYTRRLQPRAFWILELAFSAVGVAMILVSLFG